MTRYYHITIDGAPLCECEGHMSGLLSEAWYDSGGYRLCCEYSDLERARLAARRVQQLKPGRDVQVIPDPCPAMAASCAPKPKVELVIESEMATLIAGAAIRYVSEKGLDPESAKRYVEDQVKRHSRPVESATSSTPPGHGKTITLAGSG